MEQKITHCPQCKGESYLVEWKPPHGIDPRLRSFQCGSCGCIFYTIIRVYKASLLSNRLASS